MTIGPDRDPRRRVSVATTTTAFAVLSAASIAVLGAASIAVLGAASTAALAAPATAASATRDTHSPACAQAKHRFIDADTATVKGAVIKVIAHKAKFHCGGEDDGHYTASRPTETLRISKTATITVFKHPEDPSDPKTVKATALPHWLKKNSVEPIYRIEGPKSKITTMTEQFHP
jgi:hypothetical protein